MERSIIRSLGTSIGGTRQNTYQRHHQQQIGSNQPVGVSALVNRNPVSSPPRATVPNPLTIGRGQQRVQVNPQKPTNQPVVPQGAPQVPDHQAIVEWLKTVLPGYQLVSAVPQTPQ